MNFSKDVFSLIGKHLDGLNLVNCMKTCKTWYRYVKEIPELFKKVYLHYIKVEDRREFGNVISKTKLKDLKWQKFQEKLDFILWYKYGVNIFSSNLRVDGSSDISIIYLLRKHGCWGENWSHLINKMNGDMHFVNDFPGRGFLYHKKWQEFSNYMNKIKTMFPGLLDWKLIKFPRPLDHYKIYCHGRHFQYGYCVNIIIRVNEKYRNNTFEITSLLKKAKPIRTSLGYERHTCWNSSKSVKRHKRKLKHFNEPLLRKRLKLLNKK